MKVWKSYLQFTGTFGIFIKIPVVVIAALIAPQMCLPLCAIESGKEPSVLGYQKCIDCHELPAQAWMQSGHAQRSLEMLSTNLRALRYTQRLGIDPSELVQGSVCVDCHGTRQHTTHGPGHAVDGVSCESCHGPAGASANSVGWYELHSGEESLPDGNKSDLDKVLKEAGMAGSGNLYRMAVRCYGCHSVSNEAVVQAGHVTGTHEFEFTSWFSGEVRHNFAPYTVEVEDEELNSTASHVWLARHQGTKPTAHKHFMYVIGQLADLEVNLRNRAKATREGTFATSAASRSTAALVRLRHVAEHLNDNEFVTAIDDIETVRPLLFLPPKQKHESHLIHAAEQVACAAQKFIAKHDGSELSAIESLMPRETKGQAFQP